MITDEIEFDTAVAVAAATAVLGRLAAAAPTDAHRCVAPRSRWSRRFTGQGSFRPPRWESTSVLLGTAEPAVPVLTRTA